LADAAKGGKSKSRDIWDAIKALDSTHGHNHPITKPALARRSQNVAPLDEERKRPAKMRRPPRSVGKKKKMLSLMRDAPSQPAASQASRARPTPYKGREMPAQTSVRERPGGVMGMSCAKGHPFCVVVIDRNETFRWGS